MEILTPLMLILCPFKLDGSLNPVGCAVLFSIAFVGIACYILEKDLRK